MIMPLEVLYQRTSHYLVFMDASGFQGENLGVKNIADLNFILEQSPSDLTLSKKSNMLVLQRAIAGLSKQLMSAQAASEYSDQQDEIDQALVAEPYTLVMIISDSQSRFHSQRFTLDVSSQVKYSASLYRSVKGTLLGASGGVYAQLKYTDQLPAAWAVVTVSIAMANALPSLVFKAQADANGEFLLAFDRLPMPNLASNDTQYNCSLSIQSDRTLALDSTVVSSNTTTFNSAQLALDGNDLAQLSAQFNFEFQWGDKKRLSSQNAPCLYLQAGD